MKIPSSMLAAVASIVMIVPATAARAADPAAPATAPRRNAEKKKVAILIFNGVQIIDYTGPYEVFGQARADVYTVAEKSDALTTSMGMTVVPKYTLDNCPQPDILVLPGGNVDPNLKHPEVIRWVKQTADRATYVLSVCNGAFFLGKAGLLDGLSATTFHRLIDELQRQTPKCNVVSDQRFVDNGKIITTAGLTSGIDGSLHVVEKLYGKGFAQQLALGIEYNWQPESGFARAKLADMHLMRTIGRGFDVSGGAAAKLESTHGDADHWEKIWEIQGTSTSDLRRIVETTLAKSWTKVKATASSGHSRTDWKFVDQKGKDWRGASRVDPISGKPDCNRVTIQIDRAGQ